MWDVFLCFAFFSALRVSNPLSTSPPCSSVSFFSVESLYLQTLISSPFRLLAVFLMARSKVTPNPPPSSRNPLTKTRRANPSSSRHSPRDPNVPSSQVARPASSRPSQSQPNPPHTSTVVRSLPDYKQLYPWASLALLGETSSINTDRDILRLRKGDQDHLSFSKEHDDKVSVRPCPPGEPICTDNQGSDNVPLCFVYATTFKKVKLRFPFTRFERELLTELDIAPA